MLADQLGQLTNLKVLEVYYCDSFEPTLRTYLDLIISYKDLSRSAGQASAMLISSVQKELGLKREYTTLAFDNLDGKAEVFSVVEGVTLYKSTGTRTKVTNVGVAAAIASKRRVRIYKAMREIQAQGGKLLYVQGGFFFASFSTPCTPSLSRDAGRSLITLISDGVFVGPYSFGLLRTDGKAELRFNGFSDVGFSFQDLKDLFYRDIEVYLDFVCFSSRYSLTSSITQQQRNLIFFMKINKRYFSIDLKNTKPYCI